MVSKHILVISQLFYPEEFRINDICKEWVKRGYQVTVITGIPNYPQGKFYEGYGLFKKKKETYQGIEIIRIPLIPRGNNGIMLILNYFSFIISGFFWQAFTKIKADEVFIFEVSPMTQALPGVWYAKKKKVPCFIYVQDLWPENVEIISGIQSKVIMGWIGKMVDYIYKHCTHIFTTSKSFIEAIHKRGVSKNKLTFWPQFAEDFYQPKWPSQVAEIPQDTQAYNVIFTGNIGQAQGLDILVEVAKKIKGRTKKEVYFNLVGDGRYKAKLVHLVTENNVSEMFRFISKQPAEKIPEFLGAADVAYLGLSSSPLFKMTIPAKLQSYLACGMPILASASGEVMNIIKSAEVGLCSEAGDATSLAENLLLMVEKSTEEQNRYRENAIRYNKENFDKHTLLDQMDLFFNLEGK